MDFQCFFKDLQCSPKFFEDLELRRSGNNKFSEILNLGASDLQNDEAVLAYVFSSFWRCGARFPAPARISAALVRLWAAPERFFNDLSSNSIDSEAKFESNSKPISIEVNRI